jgi:hypothetical protein
LPTLSNRDVGSWTGTVTAAAGSLLNVDPVAISLSIYNYRSERLQFASFKDRSE